VEIDHVLIRVADLDAAVRAFETRYGLSSVPGGRHPGWGTANRIVPLGESYLELVAVVDDAEAAASPFGSWVASVAPARPFGWAVRTEDVDAVAQRLGLRTVAGERAAPDGRRLEWRTAGVERAAEDPSLPFFIQWGEGTPFPGAEEVPGTDSVPGTGSGVRLELEGDPNRLANWLGPHDLPIAVRDGAPGIARVVLGGATSLP